MGENVLLLWRSSKPPKNAAHRMPTGTERCGFSRCHGVMCQEHYTIRKNIGSAKGNTDDQGRQLRMTGAKLNRSLKTAGRTVPCWHHADPSGELLDIMSVTQEEHLKSHVSVAISTGKSRGDRPARTASPPLEVALLTGGGDKPYALGLASALIAQGVAFDFIGSDEVNGPELHQSPLVRFFNLRDQRPNASLARKVFRVLSYYGRLLHYTATARPKVFHVLWHNKLEWLDRTLLLLYYRLLGKRIVFTAHNVNAGKRDGNDTLRNRLTLGAQYHLVDHVFVHTEKMKRELGTEFAVPDCKISVIPFGINSTVPNTSLTPAEARQKLGIATRAKTILFFGNIAPYKGLEYLVEAVAVLMRIAPDYRMLIVGRPKNCASYWDEIQRLIARAGVRPNVIERIEFVPDEETEIYFKAADVLVLPYTHIFQSGVLFLGYNFGLPVVASDVGSLKEDILEGRTGFVCRPKDSQDLARALERYFASDIYLNLELRRQEIRDFAAERYSWAAVGDITRNVYAGLLKG